MRAGGVDHGRLRSGGLTHRPHKINHPAASLITSLPCLLQPPGPPVQLVGGFWEPRLSYFLIFSPVPGLAGTLRAKQQSCGFFPFPVARAGSAAQEGGGLTLACIPTSCWSYWFHWPASTPKQSWGLGKSKRSTVDLLALGLMGLLSSQPPLTILVGLWRWLVERGDPG